MMLLWTAPTSVQDSGPTRDQEVNVSTRPANIGFAHNNICVSGNVSAVAYVCDRDLTIHASDFAWTYDGSVAAVCNEIGSGRVMRLGPQILPPWAPPPP